MLRMAPKYKQMTFDTAIRNPERYKGILSAIVQFNGQILSDDVLLEIMYTLYKSGIVTISNDKNINILGEVELKNLIKSKNSSRNADGGFPKGYQSRFWTYMRTLSELGFVYARYNQSFRLSSVAKDLVSDSIDEQEAFSVQTMLFNRRSPYRNVLNDFNYFYFIINILLFLKNIKRELSDQEFVLFLFSKDGNVDDFLYLISKNDFNNIDVYSYITKNYSITTKEKTIMRDYPDVVLRVLRLTGFITIVYKGKQYISINEERLVYIRQLLKIKFVLNETQKEDALAFFTAQDSMYTILKEKILYFRDKQKISGVDYTKRIAYIISMYNLNTRIIVDLLNQKKSNDVYFKYIPEPLKLEFCIALLLYLTYGKEYAIKPNYKIDSLGMPISHAPGNKGDIEVVFFDMYWLIEVTLIGSKAQQLNYETTTTIRHLFSSENIASMRIKYLSFVAPYIHNDTEEWYKYSICNALDRQNAVYIKPYSIKDFIDVTVAKNNLQDMEEYSKNVIEEFRLRLFNSTSSLPNNFNIVN